MLLKTLKQGFFILALFISIHCSATETFWVGCLKTSSNFYLKAELSIENDRFEGKIHFLKYSVTFPVQGEIQNGKLEFNINFFKLDNLHFTGILSGNTITGKVDSRMLPGKFWLTTYTHTIDRKALTAFTGWYKLPDKTQLQLTIGSESFLSLSNYQNPAQHSLMPHSDSTFFVWADTLNNPLSLRIENHKRPSSSTLMLFDGKKEIPVTRIKPEVKEEMIVVSGTSVTIYGTLHYKTLPQKLPLIVLIPGSGSQGKDDYYYLQLTNYFLAKGFAVLVYDKRGVGESTGAWYSASYDNLADDVAVLIENLKNHPAIDSRNIISFGFSQGGVIAPLVSQKTKSVSLVVNAMGSATLATEQELFDIMNECSEVNINATEQNEVTQLLDRYFLYAQGKSGWSEYETLAVQAKTKKWFVCAGVPPQDEHDWRVQFWKANANFNGADAWSKITVPALIVYGKKDSNVPTEKSLINLKNLKKENSNKNVFEIKVYKNQGHLLQEEQLNFIADWIKLHQKK